MQKLSSLFRDEATSPVAEPNFHLNLDANLDGDVPSCKECTFKSTRGENKRLLFVNFTPYSNLQLQYLPGGLQERQDPVQNTLERQLGTEWLAVVGSCKEMAVEGTFQQE